MPWGDRLNFTGAHILSINQFQRQDVERVFAVADQMQPYALRKKVTRVLEEAILGNMFFEASTRTRVSFGSAFNLLGGEVRETAGFESSALVKGESLQDTARVLSGFSDVICMRHPQEGSVADFASASRVPVMNGGDGANEHPTQALLDLYTIRSELEARGRAIDGLKIAMIGDLRHGRTVHSLSKLLSVYNHIEVVLVSPRELCLPAPIIEAMRSAGVLVKESHELTGGISDVDIVFGKDRRTTARHDLIARKVVNLRMLEKRFCAYTENRLRVHVRDHSLAPRECRVEGDGRYRDEDLLNSRGDQCGDRRVE